MLRVLWEDEEEEIRHQPLFSSEEDEIEQYELGVDRLVKENPWFLSKNNVKIHVAPRSYLITWKKRQPGSETTMVGTTNRNNDDNNHGHDGQQIKISGSDMDINSNMFDIQGHPNRRCVHLHITNMSA